METVVDFKAGLMALADGRLSADPRKGLLRVAQDEAGLVHLLWFERDAAGSLAAEPEKDIVIIPGECSFGKIPRPGSRVFELKFPEEKHRNMFFWAQEPSAEEDDDYVAAINAALSLAGESSDSGAEAMDAEAAPAAAAAAAQGGGGSAGPGPIGAADLAAVLGNIFSSAGGGGGGLAAALAAQRAAADPGPSLGDVLKPELVAPLLQAPEMAERLAPYLPEEHRSAAAIAELVSTPQFRHQLDLFSHALMTGQLDTSQFGLPAGGFGVLDFLKSIQEKADKDAVAKQAAAPGGGADAAQQ